MVGIENEFNQSNSDYWRDLKTKVRATTDILAEEDTKNVVAEIKAHNEEVFRDFDDIKANPHLGPSYIPYKAIVDGNYPHNNKSHS